MKNRNALHSVLLIILITALFLLLVFFTTDLFIFPIFQGKFSRKVVMPDIRDLDSLTAVNFLSQEGLSLGPISHAYHESVPEGHIIYQIPFPGHVIKKKRRVRFTLSLGEELIVVPDLMELSPSQASDTLQALGLHLGATREVYGERKTPGTIIKSDPPAGSSIPRGGTVDITITQSGLTGKTYVPDFVKVSLEKAKKKLKKYSLKLGQVSYRKAPDLLPGTVLEQSIRPGSSVNRGTYIDFVASE
jgi:serine/threonine-protein kinase